MLKHQPYEFQCRGRVKVKGKGEMTTYFLTDRKQPATVRVDDIAMMMKQPNQQNNLMAMYGGVITPLALVHQQIRQPHHQQIGPLVQLRPVGRSNSGSGSRSCDRSPMHDPRFHLLSEELMPFDSSSATSVRLPPSSAFLQKSVSPAVAAAASHSQHPAQSSDSAPRQYATAQQRPHPSPTAADFATATTAESQSHTQLLRDGKRIAIGDGRRIGRQNCDGRWTDPAAEIAQRSATQEARGPSSSRPSGL